ncbi:MAG: methyltransferase type 11 [uncultured bacterium]|nr:MAG: methyltransferase type 11 [uncultured bacterium]
MKTKQLKEEADFFNSIARRVNINKIKPSLGLNTKRREGSFIHKYLPNNLKNKRVLDLGCGYGASSVYFAKKGARVVAIDASPESIKLAKKLARQYKVRDRVKFITGDVEQLILEKDTYDIVFGKAILHHLTISKVVPIIHRCLVRKGGKAIFIEPLGFSPFFSLYDRLFRRIARTSGELRLKQNDLSIFQTTFTNTNWIAVDILPCLLYMVYFCNLIIKNDVKPYWHRKIYDAEDNTMIGQVHTLLDRLDNFLPCWVQKFGWKIIICSTK